MTEAMVKVSIVIVNYKTAGLIADCVHSIQEKTQGVGYEVIVVDNASGDGVDALMRDRFGDAVRCVMLDENIGFGRANNAGFAVAQGEYVLCLNPDTLLVNNAIKHLADYMDEHEEAGACGGNLYDADMRPAYSFYRVLPGLRWELFTLSAQKLPALLYRGSWCHCHTDKAIEVACVTGADLMLRRDVVEQTGGFSDAFFMYYEETDLCSRIIATGRRIVCVPWAKIQHLEGASFSEGATVSQRRYEMIETGRRTYMTRNLPAVKRWLCNGVYGFNLWLYRCIFKCMNNPLSQWYDVRLRAFRTVNKK